MKRTLVSRVAAMSFAILSPAFLSSADTDIPGHVYFSYAEGNPDLGIMSRKPEYAGGAMLLTEELTYRYDGCRIEEISIANGYFPNQDIAPIQIFCTCRLDSAPFLALDSEMDLDHPHEYKAHALPQPLTIQGGKPFYVGFVVWAEGRELPDFSSPLVTDRSDTASPGRYTAWSETTDRPEKMDWTDDIASGQLCIKLKISGKMPVNVAELNKVSMTDYIETSADCKADLYVTNRGMNAISDIDVSCRVGNHTESYHVIFHSPLEYNGTGVERIKVSSKEEGANIPVTFTIDKVNGSDASDTACRQQELSIHSLARGNGFFRNMVVEEAGGSGCGACVRGMVGLDRTFKAHDDGTFIPISSHGSGYGEETCAEGYEVFHDRYIKFVPTCLINRKVARHGIVDPSSERLEGYYRMETADPAIAALEVTGYEFCGNELTVESEVEFACGETGADYRVAYVVTEDGVGPYMQTNDRYSGKDVDMDGWENLPSTTPAYYDFLARGISDFYGTGDGLPADIEPGVRYRHCGKVPLDKVRDFDRLHVVGMLINAGTGCIENGTRMKISRGMGAGGITDGVGDGPVEYFDLAGRRIGGVPSPGVYVRRQGSHSAKIVIRQP